MFLHFGHILASWLYKNGVYFWGSNLTYILKLHFVPCLIGCCAVLWWIKRTSFLFRALQQQSSTLRTNYSVGNWRIAVITIKIAISSNLIGSFNILFSFMTADSFIRECPVTRCCYWTLVIGQLNKPITTRVPGFLTNQQQERVTMNSSNQQQMENILL